ncbi:hypothetical protein FAIPA1_190011 [Frankia sp. AiPs1]|uniref:hypothetical protein n=1 Tax=Frankia sp. AiPa1 TaxID=573492 RepID=UPI00202B0C87|nr:hypothetical protein [Frankia sp. AiPa1]MCL9759704.1 hypothetical protein [Frankia sp. AiPa1]
MTSYQCPRADLGCAAVFTGPGDLDWHFRMAHGYRRLYRVWTSLRPPVPIGGRPERHVPDGLLEGPGTPTLAEQRADRELATRGRRRGRPGGVGRGGGADHGHTGANDGGSAAASGTGRPGGVGGARGPGSGPRRPGVAGPEAGVLAGLRPSAARAAAAIHHRRRSRHARSAR